MAHGCGTGTAHGCGTGTAHGCGTGTQTVRTTSTGTRTIFSMYTGVGHGTRIFKKNHSFNKSNNI